MFGARQVEKTTEPDSGYIRLEQQIAWYDKKSGSAQWWYKLSKLIVIMAAAAISITALLEWNIAAALLGALTAVCEGLQHLNQWQHNWITYRSTCEALRHEKYTFIERADPYDDMPDPDARRLLVERVESLISTEHSKWIASQEKETANSKGRDRSARIPN
jgi:hypothetical protein